MQTTNNPKWYIVRNGSQFGPFSKDQLVSMCNTGKIVATDCIFRAGMKKPVPVCKVKELPLYNQAPSAAAPATPVATPPGVARIVSAPLPLS